MRFIGFILMLVMGLCLCLGGNAVMAAQEEQGQKEQPAAQTEEQAKAKEVGQEKDQKDSQQPQPANVPVIKKDEGC